MKNSPPPDQSVISLSPNKNTPLPDQSIKLPSPHKNAPPPDQYVNSPTPKIFPSSDQNMKSPPKNINSPPSTGDKKEKENENIWKAPPKIQVAFWDVLIPTVEEAVTLTQKNSKIKNISSIQNIWGSGEPWYQYSSFPRDANLATYMLNFGDIVSATHDGMRGNGGLT